MPSSSETESDTFAHDADIGVVGRGPTVEAAFIAAARSMFGIMTDVGKVRPERTVTVTFAEADPEFALVTWLNQLLGRANAEGLVLGQFTLTRDGERWHGSGAGEPWRPDLERGTQVKGATLTALAVRPRPGGFEARCVVDV